MQPLFVDPADPTVAKHESIIQLTDNLLYRNV